MHEAVRKLCFLDGGTPHAVWGGAAEHAKKFAAKTVISIKGHHLEDGMACGADLENLRDRQKVRRFDSLEVLGHGNPFQSCSRGDELDANIFSRKALTASTGLKLN
eukprot:6478757-Amphidinium_carterae.2